MDNRIFAIGDIHGCFNSFKELIEKKIKIVKCDSIILLGDYIDRGTDSNKVIDYVIDLTNQGYNIIPLLGNHEQMLIDAWNDKNYIARWILNGGSETLKSFGINSISELDNKYLDFFYNLKPYVKIKNHFFVHAGFNDEIESPFDDIQHMIWKCRRKYSHKLFRDATIVHGHCPITKANCDNQILNHTQVINIDTGCVYAGHTQFGRLSAYEINSQSISFA